MSGEVAMLNVPGYLRSNVQEESVAVLSLLQAYVPSDGPPVISYAAIM